MARKISLREFQESVVAKLQSLATSETSNTSKLGVQVGADHWLVNLSDISEVLPMPESTEVPLTQPWFGGVANFRGNLYGIVDFSHFQGGAPTPRGVDTRLLLIHQKFLINAGIVVSRMLGLRNPESMRRSEVDQTERPWVTAEYQDENGQRWQELNMQVLAEHPQFLNVGLS